VPEEQLVFAYYNETLFSFERAYGYSASEFGGPIDVKLSGIEHDPKPLHLIAQLSASDLRLMPTAEGDKLFDIPLIYGMCFDGCNIDYHVDIKGNIEIRKMSPTESSDDWPYRNYPALLPYLPLRVGETRNCSYAEFAELFCNMPEQQTTELVVAVPTPMTLGVSLWAEGPPSMSPSSSNAIWPSAWSTHSTFATDPIRNPEPPTAPPHIPACRGGWRRRGGGGRRVRPR
jgi:hypothetical protein